MFPTAFETGIQAPGLGTGSHHQVSSHMATEGRIRDVNDVSGDGAACNKKRKRRQWQEYSLDRQARLQQ